MERLIARPFTAPKTKHIAVSFPNDNYRKSLHSGLVDLDLISILEIRLTKRLKKLPCVFPGNEISVGKRFGHKISRI